MPLLAHPSPHRWLLGLCAGLVLAASPAARAEGPVQALKLAPSQRFAHTRSALAHATSGAEPQRYVLEQTNILQPVSVTLVAPAHSGLKLVLSKVAAEPLRQATLNAQGMANIKFRTEGGFYAAVHGGGKPVPYYLLVLVGEEEKRKLPAIVVPMSRIQGAAPADAAAPAQAASTKTWWLAAGAAAAFGLGGGAWALRRRSST